MLFYLEIAKDCCWNPYLGRTLSLGVSTLPQSWSFTSDEDKLASWWPCPKWILWLYEPDQGVIIMHVP
ncbi:hypothetical protein EG68_05817 [Paragonimus skrjabini miyazakii]|uniref:Uncharacterized protein n=1 Tax=Paragonimus skrjabini miyazakii TaxID=59628 RepID=A0A8S9YVP4_9TREM|nr:hypothetical protein EG68_05817 [Paragonimus skrjabini miyazakii]